MRTTTSAFSSNTVPSAINPKPNGTADNPILSSTYLCTRKDTVSYAAKSPVIAAPPQKSKTRKFLLIGQQYCRDLKFERTLITVLAPTQKYPQAPSRTTNTKATAPHIQHIPHYSAFEIECD